MDLPQLISDTCVLRHLILSDSTVLAYVLSELNKRHNYGLDLFLLSVDEGITGYRDDSLETVKRNEMQVKWSEFRLQVFCHLHYVMVIDSCSKF